MVYSVCYSATDWQEKLQTALMGNKEFHKTVTELLEWTELTKTSIKNTVIDYSLIVLDLKEEV